MESNVKKDLLSQCKNDSTKFPFIFSDENGQEEFLHEILGLPTLPLIGKYQKNEYKFMEMMSILSLNCIKESTGESVFLENFSNQLKLPQKVLEVIQKIPENIKLNKGNTKQEQHENPTDLSSHIQNLKIQNNHQDQNEQRVIDSHPIQFKPSRQFKFTWLVFKNNIANQLVYSKKEQKEQKQQQSSNYFNIVAHSFLFGSLDFSKSKRLRLNVPCCLVDIDDYQSIREYEPQQKAIKVDELRSEYQCVHFKNNALCFSPNNLRVLIKDNEQVCHFYLIFMRESRNYEIFYLWVVNSEAELVLESFSNAQNLNELIQELEFILDQNHSCIKSIKSLFLEQSDQNKIQSFK